MKTAVVRVEHRIVDSAGVPGAPILPGSVRSPDGAVETRRGHGARSENEGRAAPRLTRNHLIAAYLAR